jgi:hypothetical protein
VPERLDGERGPQAEGDATGFPECLQNRFVPGPALRPGRMIWSSSTM